MVAVRVEDIVELVTVVVDIKDVVAVVVEAVTEVVALGL
jgi:hypothetical protein